MAQKEFERAYYLGPYFRYERPQKGRLRQFHQYGGEIVGTAEPLADAEIIAIVNAGYDDSRPRAVKMFYPFMLDAYESSDCEFYIGEKCLYDSVRIRYASAASSNPDSIKVCPCLATWARSAGRI